MLNWKGYASGIMFSFFGGLTVGEAIRQVNQGHTFRGVTGIFLGTMVVVFGALWLYASFFGDDRG